MPEYSAPGRSGGLVSGGADFSGGDDEGLSWAGTAVPQKAMIATKAIERSRLCMMDASLPGVMVLHDLAVFVGDTAVHSTANAGAVSAIIEPPLCLFRRGE